MKNIIFFYGGTWAYFLKFIWKTTLKNLALIIQCFLIKSRYMKNTSLQPAMKNKENRFEIHSIKIIFQPLQMARKNPPFYNSSFKSLLNFFNIFFFKLTSLLMNWKKKTPNENIINFSLFWIIKFCFFMFNHPAVNMKPQICKKKFKLKLNNYLFNKKNRNFERRDEPSFKRMIFHIVL